MPSFVKCRVHKVDNAKKHNTAAYNLNVWYDNYICEAYDMQQLYGR